MVVADSIDTGAPVIARIYRATVVDICLTVCAVPAVDADTDEGAGQVLAGAPVLAQIGRHLALVYVTLTIRPWDEQHILAQQMDNNIYILFLENLFFLIKKKTQQLKSISSTV